MGIVNFNFSTVALSEPFSFPKGFFANLVIKAEKEDRPLLKTYIEERFYVPSEVQFNFWILIYKNFVGLAMQLANNERESISLFLDEMERTLGVHIEVNPDDPNMKLLVKDRRGLQWAVKQTMILNLHFFTKELVESHNLEAD